MGRLTHRTAPGRTYFVTTKASRNRSFFQVTEIADIIVEVLLRHRTVGAYLLHEFVLMPNHLHLLLTPGHKTSLEKAMQLIKGGSSYEIHKRRGDRSEIWQSGFHEATIRDERDFQAKTNYLRMNPVEAGLVEKPVDWRHGSASGKYPLDPSSSNLSSATKAAHSPTGVSELKLRHPVEGARGEL